MSRAVASVDPGVDPDVDQGVDLRIGVEGIVHHTVGEADAASAWGNDLPVLATPVLLWLAEIACMRAVEHGLDETWMTVGARHDCSHRAPTRVGQEVVVTARLVEVDGRLLTFEVSAHDEEHVVLSGRHTRGLVGAESFRRRLGLAR